jgi:hypothetical protein
LKGRRYLAQGVNAHMRARPWPLCHGVIVRAAEKAAAAVKKDYETRRTTLSAKIERLIAEMTA